MQRADSLEKTLMLAKIEGRRWKGQKKTRWLDVITHSMDISLSNLWEMVMLGSLACCSPQGHKESDMTEWPNSNKKGFQNSSNVSKKSCQTSATGGKEMALRFSESECQSSNSDLVALCLDSQEEAQRREWADKFMCSTQVCAQAIHWAYRSPYKRKQGKKVPSRTEVPRCRETATVRLTKR